MRRWIIGLATFAVTFAFTMHALLGSRRTNADLASNDPYAAARVITVSQNDSNSGLAVLRKAPRVRPNTKRAPVVRTRIRRPRRKAADKPVNSVRPRAPELRLQAMERLREYRLPRKKGKLA